MAIPQVQNDLVTALAKTGKPVVIVLVAGSPVELPWFNDVAAMLYVGLVRPGRRVRHRAAR